VTIAIHASLTDLKKLMTETKYSRIPVYRNQMEDIEGFVYLTPGLHNHTGMFIDNPNDNDITAIPNTLFGRTYNSAIWSNVLWDVTKNYRIAFEATHRRTEYKEPTNLPNDGLGVQTQFQWTF
jgi:hypothetical protein